VIELTDISKIFNMGKTNEYVALSGINLAIQLNRITVFRGPSGSGKTTLLSIIGCMARPTSGRIQFMEREITSLPERFLTEIRQKKFGFIFQQLNLIKGITALENVMLPSYPSGEPYSSLKKRTLGLFDMFNIPDRAGAKVEWLSGGEAQRVAIARAMINNPAVIIADEPTAHLDSKLSKELMGIMDSLKSEGKTVLIASHDPLIYESAAVDRIVDLRDGRVDGAQVS
jgi:putative ABC transport system ATP-binding protein